MNKSRIKPLSYGVFAVAIVPSRFLRRRVAEATNSNAAGNG
jgi:hypothetical protein